MDEAALVELQNYNHITPTHHALTTCMRVASGATGLRCWRGTRSSHARTRPACLLPNRKRLGGHGARRSGRADHDALQPASRPEQHQSSSEENLRIWSQGMLGFVVYISRA